MKLINFIVGIVIVAIAMLMFAPGAEGDLIGKSPVDVITTFLSPFLLIVGIIVVFTSFNKKQA